MSVFFNISAYAQSSVVSNDKATLLVIQGAIGPAVRDFIHVEIDRAVQAKNKAIILQLDTPGGLSESMREIIQDILSSPIPVLTYVAPSGARAASAGTYILYASHVAAMAPGTNLGAATPVSLGLPGQGEEKDKAKEKTKSAMEMKAINDARAYIRGLAQLRGRNIDWAEKAVSQAESLSANEALKLHVIDFVAQNIQDLLKQANGKKVMVQGGVQTLQTTNLSVQEIKANWRTKFLMVITDPSIAYLLLIIGFYGIFFEFVSPGFILPGVIGGICLLLAAYGLHLLPVNYAGLALIFLGVAFLVAEVFMPSGALGIGGIVSFIFGSVLLFKADVGWQLPWTLIISVSVVTALFFLGVLQLVVRARQKKIVSGLESMIGTKGIIVKTNREIWAQIEGELWKVESTQSLREGDFIIVKSVQGLILKVDKTSQF